MRSDPTRVCERLVGPATRITRVAACAWLGILAVSCAASVQTARSPVFFPPAPQLPRIQHLTSFAGLADIEEQSAFNRFVVGKKQDARLDKPYGVAIHEGKIYVCDTNGSVVVFDLKNKTYGGLKGALGAGRLVQPMNIAIGNDGTKYVADPLRGQVVAFDRNDDYRTAYGSPGAWRPVDAVPFGDRLYVVDAANRLVQVFDLGTGEPLETIGDKGAPEERLDRPSNLAIDAVGDVYVTDVGRFQIVRFDRDGHFRAAIGRVGDAPGHFARPKGVALDRNGRLYAVDASFNNVQVFDEDGRLLMFFGGSGEEPGSLLLPAKVAIDYDNVQYFEQYLAPDFDAEYLILVTSQFGTRLVNVLAYGRDRNAAYPGDADLFQEIDERRRKAREKVQQDEQKQ